MTQNPELYRALQPYLEPDEDLLWIGRPSSFQNKNISPFTVIFLIFWLGFAVVWTITAFSMSGGFFGIFGLVFVAFGIGMIYSMSGGRKRILQQTVYAVTDRRAIILATLPRKGTTCTEYIFKNLPRVSLENIQGNVGTIRFSPEVPLVGWHHNRVRTTPGMSYDSYYEITTAFYMIEDIHTVHRLISERLG